MAGPSYQKTSYWPNVMIVSEEQIKSWMTGFEIVSFTEHRSSGQASDGVRSDRLTMNRVSRVAPTATAG